MKCLILSLMVLLGTVSAFLPTARHRNPCGSKCFPGTIRRPIRSRIADQPSGRKARLRMNSIASEDNDEVIEGRKIIIMLGYRLSALVYLFLGTFIVGWQGLKSPSQLPLALYVSAGPVLASGVSYVLEGAAVNDRLSSEAFKRLNLCLASYGALWLLAAYLIRNTGSRIVCHPLVLSASAITGINSVRAWIFGVKGWDTTEATSLISDLKATFAKVLRSVLSFKSFPGLVYLFATIVFSGLKFSRLIDVYQLLASGGVSATVFSKDIFRISMYSLLSAVSMTLKDGAGKS